ncbi:sulfide/dihydroorotate dehydrogenase-like FAD/NAD-binding protein [Clostridium sp. 19966]|uniref:sulfide/dihydroorotate dehydrogenase-like FAD/NAD-binding protein n=1 Tax=Clostridium sp. 19966 TaxID=2768166 RepID=UPI0028DE057A|nr:sulfide/dihydroorotate dehydrogenase-like FAD/NAD-binding protein [Clostridium sp. 19966]MDT8716560.1 sulfide/dihydroorotate dehydrogenase-like FAD/NAD-binding protein [Clostridium sp. 19966]
MNHEIANCIDSGTEYCPCHLAEVGECILCSRLSGKTFCDCNNWNGVCIYTEFINNSNKPKENRKNYICKVLDKAKIQQGTIEYTLSTPYKITQDLAYPGSFIFIRSPKTFQFYDTPISIMECNLEENWIKFVVEIKGIKTKNIEAIEKNDNMLIRGPFWNGIFGLKNIYSARDGVSIVIARAIGQAPAVPVIKKLHENGNRIIAILDDAVGKELFVNKYLEKYQCEVIRCSTIYEDGNLTKELKDLLTTITENEHVNLLQCNGPDILNKNIAEFLDGKVKISCCNNAKMCCGQGVCGSCSTKYDGNITKRLCKLQVDPVKIFEGRRSI